MLPPATAAELNDLGHDALGVHDAQLTETADDIIYRCAVGQRRVVVTENLGDFARIVEQRHTRDETCVPVVFVRKRDFARGRALAPRLARHLHRWATRNPDPYPGVHWP